MVVAEVEKVVVEKTAGEEDGRTGRMSKDRKSTLPLDRPSIIFAS